MRLKARNVAERHASDVPHENNYFNFDDDELVLESIQEALSTQVRNQWSVDDNGCIIIYDEASDGGQLILTSPECTPKQMHGHRKRIRETLAQECASDSSSMSCHFDDDGYWVVFEEGEPKVRCHADTIADDETKDRWSITTNPITDAECLVLYSDDGKNTVSSECTPNDLGAGEFVEMFNQECDVEGPQSVSCKYDDPSCFVTFDSKSGVPNVECPPEMVGAYTPFQPSRKVYLLGLLIFLPLIAEIFEGRWA